MSIINEYKDRITTIINEPDDGIYDAMNKGVNAASGDIVGILNSDDFYQSGCVLSQVVSVFQRKQDIAIVFGDVVYSKPDDLSKVVRHYSSAHFSAWKLRFGWMPPHPATFIKRSVYRDYGRYNLTYTIAADYEMFVRLLLVHRLHFFRIDRILVRMRTGGVSTSGIKSNVLLNKEIVKACKSNGVYTNLLMVLSKFPFKLMELFRRPNPVK